MQATTDRTAIEAYLVKSAKLTINNRLVIVHSYDKESGRIEFTFDDAIDNGKRLIGERHTTRYEESLDANGRKVTVPVGVVKEWEPGQMEGRLQHDSQRYYASLDEVLIQCMDLGDQERIKQHMQALYDLGDVLYGSPRKRDHMILNFKIDLANVGWSASKIKQFELGASFGGRWGKFKPENLK